MDIADELTDVSTRATEQLRIRAAAIEELAAQVSSLEADVEALKSRSASLEALISELRAKLPNRPVWGVNDGGRAAWDGAGLPYEAVRYYRRDQKLPWNGLKTIVSLGKHPVVSIKPGPWADVIAGRRDAYIASVGNFLAPLGKMDLFIYPEPEDEGTAADFRAATTRVLRILRERLSSNVRIGVCLMTWTWQPDSGRRVQDWLIDGIDILGADGYNWKPGARWRSPVDIFAPALATAREGGLPLIIAEVGSVADPADPSRRGLWLEELGYFVRANKEIEAVCWFENVDQDTGTDWRIAGDEPAKQAWRRLTA
jgi:hypothetical protein